MLSKCYQKNSVKPEPVEITGFLRLLLLFVFHRGGGLWREVVKDAVDAGDLGGDALHEAVDQVGGEVLYGNFYDVHGIDGADDAGPVEGALAVLDAGGLEVGHDGEVLPDFALKAVFGELFAKDGVGLADGLEPVACDGAHAADSQAGAGEGLAEDHAVGKAQGFADDADLILIKELDGLYELEILHVFWKASDVVVGLDAILGFQDVRVYGALAEEADAGELAGFFGKDLYEDAAYDLALGLRVGDAGKSVEEAVDCVHVYEIEVELLAEDFADLLGLAFAQKAVVDVHAGEALAYGFGDERRADGGVYAAGKGQQHLTVRADLLVDGCDLLFYERLGELGSCDPLH